MVAVWQVSDEVDAADWYVPPSPAPRHAAATYRRRRIVVAAVVLVLAALGWRLGSGLAVAPGDDSQPPPAPASYVVQPGDTLWSTADRVGGDRDVRAVVADLIAENGGDTVYVGHRVTLPVPLAP